MATTNLRLAKGTAPTTLTAVYTVPANTRTCIKSWHVCNKNTTAAKYVTIVVAGTELIFQYPVPAKDTIHEHPVDQILEAGETIQVLGESADLVFYISGREEGTA